MIIQPEIECNLLHLIRVGTNIIFLDNIYVKVKYKSEIESEVKLG